MKQFKFVANALVFASMFTFFISCHSGENKMVDANVMTDSSAVKEAEPVAKQVLVALVKHKVANFDKWKVIYDGHDSVRLAFGMHSIAVSRGMDDPNMVMISMRVDDLARAKEFFDQPELKTTMQKGGVIGAPTISFLNVQMMDTTKGPVMARLMMTHNVKDWDSWKKEFDSHKDVRIAAGLSDKAVGYEVGNNKAVTIVFVVNDMKKAKDFLTSKDLKEKMEAAGVEGPPVSYYYNIAQLY